MRRDETGKRQERERERSSGKRCERKAKDERENLLLMLGWREREREDGKREGEMRGSRNQAVFLSALSLSLSRLPPLISASGFGDRRRQAGD